MRGTRFGRKNNPKLVPRNAPQEPTPFFPPDSWRCLLLQLSTVQWGMVPIRQFS